MSNIVAKVQALSLAPPRNGGAFDRWILQEDVPRFLTDNAISGEFILYASADHVYLRTVVTPAASLDQCSPDDLKHWDMAHDKWGLNYSWGDGDADLWLEPPFFRSSCKAYEDAEPLVFHRTFEGYSNEKSYFEISQKLLHVFDLHYVSHKRAWCRLDEVGELEPIIQHYPLPVGRAGYRGDIISAKRSVFETYIAAGCLKALCAFDFTRVDVSNFHGWGEGRVHSEVVDETFSYDLTIQPEVGSYLRGIQIVSPLETKAEIHRRLRHGSEPTQYATFIAHDWKNDVIAEVSCAPGATANYFTESELPFEVTPAFFRPEVLHKYKADTTKYRLEHRSIHCRGAWSLQTYDINDDGQVHTYLVYLRNLPYSEQLYWKSFNEPPKGPISKRALTTDFHGNFYLEYDALPHLKRLVEALHKSQVKWWSLREDGLPEKLLYPVTTSSDEWAGEVLNLDQLIVEGLDAGWLKKTATAHGQKPGAQEGSLAVLGRCLVAAGFSEEDAKQTVLPLRELHHLRNKIKGHAKGEDAETLREDALNKFGTYRKHFEDLCTRCDTSLRRIAAGLSALDGGEIPDDA